MKQHNRFLACIVLQACFLLFCSVFAFGQARTITGTVTDSVNNPIANVSVQVQGTGTGTVTDISGNFSISVPSNSSVLVFSYTGMQTQQVTVGDKSAVNVQMSSVSGTLNEVVVIGYGTARKSDLTGSVVTVKSDRLLDRPTTDVSQALQGKVAGVQVSRRNEPSNGKAGLDGPAFEICVRRLDLSSSRSPSRRPAPGCRGL